MLPTLQENALLEMHAFPVTDESMKIGHSDASSPALSRKEAALSPLSGAEVAPSESVTAPDFQAADFPPLSSPRRQATALLAQDKASAATRVPQSPRTQASQSKSQMRAQGKGNTQRRGGR